MLLRQEVPDIEQKDIRILATDISLTMLERARRAQYVADTVSDLPRDIVQKYFSRKRNGSSPHYQVKDEVRAMVRLAKLNLMESWPMRGPFNIIFCRNVMIYFDKPTQQSLVTRFSNLLEPGGYLFVGHSESLSAISHTLRYVQPAIYRK
jgi:chemotaxis protein methyltransferase CheR